MDQIGILGGSFNPIHLGHINIAQIAMQELNLDRILFVPCKVSPFKTGAQPESFVEDLHRVRMIELSIEGFKQFELSEIELSRGGISYSYDTVAHFGSIYTQSHFFFIIGTDSLLTLSKWHKIETLLTLCDFVTVERPGFKEISLDIPGFSHEQSKDLIKNRIVGRLLDISSSDIRERIATGESVAGLVDPRVEEYIQQNNLYENGSSGF